MMRSLMIIFTCLAAVSAHDLCDQDDVERLSREISAVKAEVLMRKTCPKDFAYNAELDSSYNFVTSLRLTWLNALLYCNRMGANLVAIDSQKEYDFIKAEIERTDLGWPRGAGHDSFYTGGTMLNGSPSLKLNAWQWAGGATFKSKPMSYAPWHSTQGILTDTKDSLCHVLWAPGAYSWHDHPCHFKHHFICEI
ncbi:unnamed protein product [Owenia fusiformis]|uniref:Uncharacterized protein n=1 Tax=Owenia fusiformis TaxID=6347 RepID=A0A8J1TVC0_OWEFU|nr:unnamed protein product [Owenia fusiformis]